jgi:starch phosphorylase
MATVDMSMRDGWKSVAGAEPLAELALDLRWTWNHVTDAVWRQLDPELWERTQNPWDVLQTAAPATLQRLLADPAFHRQIDELQQQRQEAANAPTWFAETYPESALGCVAYFSMEFMLSEALPLYSGGLGNVAGDQLKAASDLGVPVIGIGLLYAQGYFRQTLDADGAQQALYPYNDPGQLPITPLRLASGEWLRLKIELPGSSIWLRGWQATVGRTRLLLLDSNDAANHPVHRSITSELYGGGPVQRIAQELVLGIGGWRMLAALGIRPDVCHLNEGHAAFAVLERAHDFMRESGQPFEVALAVTRAGTLFTTHTAVDAGFDRFAPTLIERYLGEYARQALGITLHDLLALGRSNPEDPAEPFNMAYLALRGSGAVNGVSRLHGAVSRALFAPLFPHWPLDEVPVGHVTNGVHMPSWDSSGADEVWTEACGKQRWLDGTQRMTPEIRHVSDETLWQLRTTCRASLIDFARERLALQLTAAGASRDDIDDARQLFDPQVLTLGFARRFATYKRPNLLLHDPQRLLRILGNAQRPVQLLIAGKAHPADRPGQELIREWIHFIRQADVRPHVIFLADYDMRLTEQLVQGVDLWINTPRRPWEACGTSGMKALVNGVINLSVLDGWWAEAYTPEVGWALGDGSEQGEDPASDADAASALYDLLERQVVPEFYERDGRGIPGAWVRRMRESMAQLTPQYSTNRSLNEYVARHYIPAAQTLRERSAAQGAGGADLIAWRRALETCWDTMRFDSLQIDSDANVHVITVEVCLNDVDPDAVRVEIHAQGQGDAAAFRQPMHALGAPIGVARKIAYRATVPATRPANHYTARVVPQRDGIQVPLECARILWQR